MPPEASTSAPSAAEFDQAFSASASPGIRRVWELAEPGLPAQVEPFSFVSAGLLRHVLQAAGLAPGQTLADLGCGRGGPEGTGYPWRGPGPTRVSTRESDGRDAPARRAIVR